MSATESYFNNPQVAAQLYPDYQSAMYGYSSLGEFGQLGSFEDDLKKVFSLIPGASGYYNSLVGLIEQKAKEGALLAVPDIQAKVEETVKPYVFAALLLGGAGFLFGLATYLMNRRS